MRIINEFSDKTIKLEHSRNPSTMTIDDLFWCFETKIYFYENENEPPVITVEEASFFFFIMEFQSIVESLSNGKPGQYMIKDQDGTYSLVITSTNQSLALSNTHSLQSFEIPLNEFSSAAQIWMNEAINNIENIFPDLKNNQEYNELQIHKIR